MDVDCGSARDRLGQTLGGKYRLEAVLGAGGTAVVYRASGEHGDVAIKVLHDHLSRSQEVCRRFVREGQLGNVLDHPNTVKVLDHGTTDERCPYLVLELLDGESLEDLRVRKGGRVPLAETLDYVDQLLSVLEVAHAKNVVHRDIKPSNLFVSRTGQLKVLDFGIARLVDDGPATATKTGQMVGTPAFMPPEQALSRPRDVDGRTDLWAVGATIFTLLSGEHVHIAETSSEHLVKAATLHARSLARALPGVPEHVEALVARALAFEKADRWPSAGAMRAELAHVKADPGRSVGTSTSPPPDRVPSSPHLPTFVGTTTRNEVLAGPREELSGEIDANMALTWGDEETGRRRRWLVPVVAFGSLFFLGLAVLVIARSLEKPPAPATVQATSAPPPVPVPPPAPEPTPTPVTSVLPLPSASMTPRVMAAPPPLKVTAPAPKKPASRKDVYRPF